MKEIKVTVSLEEVLEFVRDDRDCKIEIDYDGNLAEAYVLPIEAVGFEDKINTQTIEAYDYQEFDGDEEAYVDWFTGCYDRPYEAADGEEEYSIKINFEK